MVTLIMLFKKDSQATLKTPSKSVASVFGNDSDDEPEEMPPEAKMRMRNIGRYALFSI